ncbi:MAG: hypothetical protein KDA24_04510 [Deltaproteobacteria bacterium]|nr:hypothetical protein [Deltaproteobacteria bacterium]
MTGSWRVILSGLLLAAAVWIFAISEANQSKRQVPEWHTNTTAGFSIRPPPGWSSRSDDRDGSQIAPPAQPTDGFATLIVSTRLARDENPMSYLTDVVARPPAGPIRELEWIREEKIAMEDGGPGALGEFTEIYRGMPVHGWMVFAVREGKVLQAVAQVPRAHGGAAEEAILASLRSVRPL